MKGQSIFRLEDLPDRYIEIRLRILSNAMVFAVSRDPDDREPLSPPVHSVTDEVAIRQLSAKFGGQVAWINKAFFAGEPVVELVASSGPSAA